MNCQSIFLTLLKELTKQQRTCGGGGDLTGQGGRWEGERKKKKERNEIKIQIHVLLNAVIVLDLSANQEELCKYLQIMDLLNIYTSNSIN